ncbi:MAG: hypothetical protein AB1758_21740 [Candidatus Eremiobacterota bacterium]
MNLLATATYDAQTHLFLADHYARGWFEGWEPRWFGGFWVYSYPPLVHQLVALGGHLELAYQLVQLATLILLPASVWLLAREVAGLEAAGWAAWLTALSAGPLMCLYVFGQLPTIAGMALMFGAGAFLLRFLRSGHRWDLATWGCLAAAALATHHLTGLGAFPFLMLAAFVQSVGETPRSLQGRAVLRCVLAGAVAGLLSSLVLAPFVWWFSTGGSPQAEIPHPSRTNFFLRPDHAFLFFGGIWGASLPVLLASLWSLRSRPGVWPWAALVLLWGVLGLGSLTPLPRWLFPNWHHWLTYERFTLWAATLSALPAGVWLAGLRSRPMMGAVLGAFVLAGGWSATCSARAWILPPPLEGTVLREVARYLDSRKEYRYITIGLAENDLARVSRSTVASTVDGLYYTARRDPYLRASGVGALDTAQWQSPQARWVQRSVLSRPQAFGLGSGVAATSYGEAEFEAAGWVRVARVGAEGTHPPEDLRPFRVSLWRVPGRNLQAPPSGHPAVPAWFAAVWGVAPLASLLLGGVGVVVSLRRGTV